MRLDLLTDLKRCFMKKLLLFLILSFVFSIQAQTAISPVLGNPSGATVAESNADNFLVAHKGYILSYNKSRGASNWVAWHLEKSDLTGVKRLDAFAPDKSLPREWWIVPSDYDNAGFDRGHLCPSDDRVSSREANTETFLMSNMQPQTHHLNAGAWKSLEEYERQQVADGTLEAYIYAGCYGDAGRIKDKVTIPTMCWKIVVLLPEGNGDLRRVNADTRVIAVDMDNTKTTKSGWRNHRITIDELEKRTGYDFLAPLSNRIENAIEAKKNKD
jgi:endonuclease G